jgi:hypothetical protein
MNDFMSSASSSIRNCAAESGMILSKSFDKDATGAPPHLLFREDYFDPPENTFDKD